jgi:membrane fusion protein (multidrug efflux system)
MKINLFTSFILALLFLYSCGKKPKEAAAKQEKPTMSVEIHVVSASNVNEEIEAAGTLMANEQTELRAETSGRITQLNITEGAFVKKGTLLIKLFDDDLQATLKRLKSEEEIAASNEKRQGELLKIQGISQSEYDIVLNQFNSIMAEKDIIAAEIRKTEIRAPFDGYIGLRNVSLGSYVGPSDIISNLVDSRKIKVDFSIPEKYQSMIKKGDSIQFYINGSAKVYQAVVYALEPNINPETRNLKIRALYDNSKNALTPGTFASVKYKVKSRPNAIMIPSQAVIPEARTRKVVILKNNRAKIEVIETGYRDKDNVEVLSGLSVGDTIVMTGIMQIRDGMEVVPRPIKKEKAAI